MEKLFFDYETIWNCANKSGKLKAMKKAIKPYLKPYKYEFDNIGNIYIGNFEKIRPCIVAHLDSVHSNQPKNIRLNNFILLSSSGIGGDDKAGIVAIFELLKKNSDINAILTVNEEIGGLGAREIKKEKLKNVSYFVEIDRQGSSDLVNKIYGMKIASDDFLKDISANIKDYGFKFADGLYTDIYDLASTSNISAINLSCGYYNPHTEKEYVDLIELQHTIDFVDSIIKTTKKQYSVTLDYEWKSTSFYNDFQNINYDIALEDCKDINALIDLVLMADNINLEEALYKAFDLGIDSEKKRQILTMGENMAYFNWDLNR